MTKLNPIHCEYRGCTEPLAPGEEELKTGLKFCQKHTDEFDGYVKANDVRGIMRFWVKATGRGEGRIDPRLRGGDRG